MSATHGLVANERKELSYEALLQRVGQKKDRQAFIQLFQYFAPRVKSFLLKNGMRDEQAEDLMQDVMLTLWNKAADYNPRLAKASTWIFTIARNRRIDHLRKFSRPEPSLDNISEEFMQDETSTDPVTRVEEMKAVARVIRELPPEQADLIRKSFFEDKAHSTIAMETKIPLGTVKSRIRLALQKMRAALKDKEAWL